MSRYTHFHEHQKYGRVIVVYGFDRPLSEYFIQVRKMNLDDTPGDFVFIVANYSILIPHPDMDDIKSFSNSELHDLFQEYAVCEEHLLAVGLDQSF